MNSSTSGWLVLTRNFVAGSHPQNDSGYWLTQSDRGILWRMGLNPAKLTPRRVQGKDGYMMVYSNETALVYITHSAVSGVSITRMKP